MGERNAAVHAWNRQARLEVLRAAHANARMVGWDFEALEGKLVEEDPPWDFERDCVSALAGVGGAGRAVDLGTGGGERLTRLIGELQTIPQFVATEGWQPNLAVARENLKSYGVQVHPYLAHRDDRLPLKTASYDVVMSRHEAFDAAEIARVLAPGGTFLTQQVDGGDAIEFRQWFDSEFEYAEHGLGRSVQELEEAGLFIDVAEEWSGVTEFADSEALVTYLGFVPWYAPNFRVDDHEDRLISLEEAGSIRASKRRYRIYATKPG